MNNRTPVFIDPLQMTKKGSLRIMRRGVLTQDDGTISYVPERVLIDAASSFSNTPLRNEHEGQIVGTITNAYYEAPYLKGDYIIFEDGFNISNEEISAGYYAMPELNKKGEWEDDEGVIGDKGIRYKYDSIYTKILPNHVAIVPRGRAGSNVAINLDSAENINIDKTDNMPKTILKEDAKKLREESEALAKEALNEETVEENVENETLKTDTIEEIKEEIKETETVAEETKEQIKEEVIVPDPATNSAMDTLLAVIKKLELKVDGLATLKQDSLGVYQVADKNNFKRRLGIARMMDSLSVAYTEDELVDAEEEVLTQRIASSMGVELDPKLDGYSQLSMAAKMASTIRRNDALPTIVKETKSDSNNRIVYNADSGITTLLPKPKK